MKRVLGLGVIFLALVACGDHKPIVITPAPEIPLENPPAPVTSAVDGACDGLDKSGCPEAHPHAGRCQDYLAQAIGDHANVRLDCLAASRTPDAVRACGGPGYLPVRCKTQ